MKRVTFYLSVLLLGMFLTYVSGCTTTPLESCEEDEICTGKTVTACCNEDECYYEYNGVKYGDDPASLAKLANDLGCTFSASASYETDIKDLILRLESLREIARTIE
jgi:hypothetical protein